jgi:thiosulfate/3-mercaptopyruvate sulfurtransferase
MAFTTLISPLDLSDHLGSQNWAIVDCRFYLAEPERGQREYEEAHIPGAVYAHLDRDLSGRIIPGKTGRHPLPAVDEASKTFSGLGIGEGVQVVAYDSAGGALAASRLWWMLRWLGHEAAAVLDGSWQGWQKEELPVRPGVEKREPEKFIPSPDNRLVATVEEVLEALSKKTFLLVDARTPDRFRGENEIIDPVAGRIPGAVNFSYTENLDPEGYFTPPEEIRKRYKAIVGNVPGEKTIHYCGSGVTSAHNLLALVHAGSKMPRLYAGSWSEWITRTDRPTAVGEEENR